MELFRQPQNWGQFFNKWVSKNGLLKKIQVLSYYLISHQKFTYTIKKKI